MALLVPANGGSFSRSVTSPNREYGIIGPIPALRWLDLIYVSVRAQGVSNAATGFSLGPSPEAGSAAFGAGVSLLSRSEGQIEGISVHRLLFDAAGGQNLTLAVGRRVETGPSYVHVVMDHSGTFAVTWLVSVRILGLATETRERLGEPGEISFP